MATRRTGTNFQARAATNPVCGAYVALPVVFESVLTNTTSNRDIVLPAGMKMKVVAITHKAATVAGDPLLSVGSAATATKYMAAAAASTAATTATLVSANQETGAGETIRVQLVNDASADTVANLMVTVWGFVTAHATAAP